MAVHNPTLWFEHRSAGAGEPLVLLGEEGWLRPSDFLVPSTLVLSEWGSGAERLSREWARALNSDVSHGPYVWLGRAEPATCGAQSGSNAVMQAAHSCDPAGCL